jgi:D-hexose-6-phosphate mutarotase
VAKESASMLLVLHPVAAISLIRSAGVLNTSSVASDGPCIWCAMQEPSESLDGGLPQCLPWSWINGPTKFGRPGNLEWNQSNKKLNTIPFVSVKICFPAACL